MVLINLQNGVLSDTAHRKMGTPNQYGGIVYGVARYGDKNDRAGIYQKRQTKKESITIKEVFYAPKNQSQPNKVITQGKFKDAVIAWQALTAEQKKVYNIRVKNERMYGYNLFLKEYLLNN